MQDIGDSKFNYIRNFFGKLQAIVMEDEEGGKFLMNNYYPNVFLHCYNDIISLLPFKRENYNNHQRIDEILKEFGIDKECFWYLIVYMYDYVGDACKNLLTPQPSSQDIIEELDNLTDGKEKIISISIETERKKKLTITDSAILKYLEFEFDYAKLSPIELSLFSTRSLKETDKMDARRKTSYFFATQLIKFFSLEQFDKIKRRQGASVSNKEKELILSLLYVCKFMDNPESYLDTGYFNKLMKDYRGSEMNMSHKYEFTIVSF